MNQKILVVIPFINGNSAIIGLPVIPTKTATETS